RRLPKTSSSKLQASEKLQTSKFESRGPAQFWGLEFWRFSGAWSFGIWSFFLNTAVHAQTLDLPSRPTNAVSGTEFIKRVTPLDLSEREKEIFAQVTSGNIPNFL